MNYSSRIISIILCIILLIGVLSACSKSPEEENSDTSTASDSTLQEPLDDSTDTPDISNASSITLSDKSITVSGSGAKAENGILTITDGGTYVVTGEVQDGRIIVNASD